MVEDHDVFAVSQFGCCVEGKPIGVGRSFGRERFTGEHFALGLVLSSSHETGQHNIEAAMETSIQSGMAKPSRTDGTRLRMKRPEYVHDPEVM
jgi:hypothetical protein